ncbi:MULTISPECIES: hypothetical protein [unclassified Polaromonas]|uniref:hypothetical protein n=1 Tax=unclassified Polaromonas TaxID=2638319 RepID=UPI0018C8F7F5|nr:MULTISPECIES: hypothetical protein [unclassified Polaromonas]MBG6073703.1 hypothetical protein [Polaromonas sp. CG_9.7]MBG6115812.1 hypothetical protein [Polaromonas sp. CG_9.2]
MIRFEKVENFDSVKVFQESPASMEHNSAELLSLDNLKNQWILSVTDDRVIPLKIEWLDQDFAAEIRQQQIDAVIDSYPQNILLNTVEELVKSDCLDNLVVALDKPRVELYISLTDMRLSLDMYSVQKVYQAKAANQEQRYNTSLKVFFKVFNIGEIGFLESGKSTTLYILRWILNNIELLKMQGVTSLLIDDFEESDDPDLETIVGKLEAIHSCGLPLCFIQSNPLQVVGMSELNGIISVFSHVTFVVRGLLPVRNKYLNCFSEKNSLKNINKEYDFDHKRRISHKVKITSKLLFLVDEVFDIAIDGDKIRKIFNLKLAGLESSQIAKILSVSAYPKFQSVKQNEMQKIYSWRPAVVFGVLEKFYLFERNLIKKEHDKSFSGYSGIECTLPEVVPESVFSLAMQPLSDFNSSVDGAQIKTSNLLMSVIRNRIFCACGAHQEFLLDAIDKDKDIDFYLSPLHPRICGCHGMAVNQNEFKDCMKFAVLALALKGPRTSNVLDIVNNELDLLVDNSSKLIKNLFSNHEKKKCANIIDSCIGIMARKSNWLSSSEIDSRLRQFCVFLCRDYLDKTEVVAFMELTQELIASVLIDVHTGFMKLYWSHSLTVSDIKVGVIVKSKTGIAVLNSFDKGQFDLSFTSK